MSRQSHLPPRCPLQAKSTARLSNDHFTPGHKKSVSQSCILEEETPWLNDILSDTYDNPQISPLRRSVSDSATLLGSNESGSCLESSCVYGPNSPRSRERALSENVMVSELNDYFARKPIYYMESGVIGSRVARAEVIRGAGGSAEVANFETNTVKRHSGQRSRVRKLQYIAELERSVDSLQSLESELAIKVASLLQHRVALSVENNTLKQQLTTLELEKVIVEGQFRSLKNELERLKNHLALRNNDPGFSPRSVSEEVDSEAVWQMLNIGKLNINQ